MKLLASLWLATCMTALSTDYAQDYDRLKNEGDEKKLETFLGEWRKAEPEKPDALIATANYYFNKAPGLNITTKPPGDGDIAAVVDKKTGKVAGSMYVTHNPGLAKKAIDCLAEAAGKFPNRIDVRCGLAYIQQETGDFDGELATLQAMVAYSKEHAAALLWKNGAPLPSPAGTFIPVQLHDYALYYYEKRTEADDRRFLKIVDLAATGYPRHSYAFNDMAAYYDARKQPAKVREWLEKAVAADPADTLVLLNLGDVCAKLGDKEKAAGYFQRVIDLNTSADDAKEAKAALEKLRAGK